MINISSIGNVIIIINSLTPLLTPKLEKMPCCCHTFSFDVHQHPESIASSLRDSRLKKSAIISNRVEGLCFKWRQYDVWRIVVNMHVR